MNQSINYEILSVMPLTIDQGLFRSLCTIQNPSTAVDSAGGQVYTPATNVPGLVNIPCMDAVPYPVRVEATETKELADIMNKALRHVLLNGYYPTIQQYQWAVVDGVTYDILGAESDSQNTQTRLLLEIVSV